MYHKRDFVEIRAYIKEVSSMARRNKPRKRRVFLKFLIIVFSFFAILAAVMVAMLFLTVGPPDIPLLPDFTQTQTNGADESDPTVSILRAPERFGNEDRKELFFTVLILGLTEGQNANTIMVASFDGVSGEANLVSIPRDSLVNTDRWLRKINGAYPFGLLEGRGVIGGVERMQREVMSVIGFVPDFYIVIDYTAFERIIDAVGGVEIEALFHMRYDDPCQNLHINIPPGVHHMDGRMALHFARYRQSNWGYQDITDYQRIENQQTVVNAVLGSLFRPGNILRIPEFIDIFTEYVHTDLATGSLLWFAMQFQEVRGSGALATYTLPTDGTSGPPMWYEILYAPGIVELVNRTINPYRIDIELWDIDIIWQ